MVLKVPALYVAQHLFTSVSLRYDEHYLKKPTPGWSYSYTGKTGNITFS